MFDYGLIGRLGVIPPIHPFSLQTLFSTNSYSIQHPKRGFQSWRSSCSWRIQCLQIWWYLLCKIWSWWWWWWPTDGKFFGIEVKWCLHFLRVIMLLCTSYGADDVGDGEIRLIWFAVNLSWKWFFSWDYLSPRHQLITYGRWSYWRSICSGWNMVNYEVLKEWVQCDDDSDDRDSRKVLQADGY